jgi:hypothetical protein
MDIENESDQSDQSEKETKKTTKKRTRSKSRKSKSKSKSKPKTKKRKRSGKGEKRSFTVETFDGAAHNGGPTGYYRSRTPAGAASKAATKYFQSGAGDTSTKVKILLREITSGSAGKYYNYSIRRRKIKKVKLKKGVSFKYRNEVKAGSKFNLT